MATAVQLDDDIPPAAPTNPVALAALAARLHADLVRCGATDGAIRCVVISDSETWCLGRRGGGLYAGIEQIADVLARCDEVGVETPEDFGHRTAPGHAWHVVARGGSWAFVLRDAAGTTL